jgi:ribonucleoside-diphosphate reductase alpha chain
MLGVIRKHREAADRLSHETIDPGLRAAVSECWDRALRSGEQVGYRNAQVTVLAPTGTIGLLMDCDTTGIEPDFALVKFKRLAGGGVFKIVNQSVKAALHHLGYTPEQIVDILQTLIGTQKFDSRSPHVSREFLLSKGLTEEEIDRIEQRLPGVLDLRSAFARHVLGDECLLRLGIKVADFEAPGFSWLDGSGLRSDQVEEASAVICGTLGIEDAPHLLEQHLAVFDCASPCGPKGKRFISPMGHIRMMAATQPFLSGAISKTVNLPHHTTVEEIEELHLQSWKLGLKAVALYRDGCKLSQPLSTRVPGSMAGSPSGVRRRLPVKRHGLTVEAAVSGTKVYLRTGEYEDGRLGEVFIDLDHGSETDRSILNCFAISVSLGLQYGVPLSEYVDKFTFTRFEPGGLVTGHPNVKMATSIVDYVFRVLGMEYLGRTDFLQVKPASEIQRKETAGPDVEERLAGLSPDAPLCDSCGYRTVRSGSCFRCLNCGNSIGCS